MTEEAPRDIVGLLDALAIGRRRLHRSRLWCAANLGFAAMGTGSRQGTDPAERTADQNLTSLPSQTFAEIATRILFHIITIQDQDLRRRTSRIPRAVSHQDISGRFSGAHRYLDIFKHPMRDAATSMSS